MERQIRKRASFSGRVCQEKYGYEFVTVGEMGRRFKTEFDSTPQMAMAALSDWAEKGNQSIWFNSKSYRINIFADKNELWIRDIQLFDDTNRDKYLDVPCTKSSAQYDNMPIMDGIRFSTENEKAGMYFGKYRINKVEKCDSCVVVSLTTSIEEIYITLQDDKIEIVSKGDYQIKFIAHSEYISNITDKKVEYCFQKSYWMNFIMGYMADGIIYSEDGKVTISFSC